jgi:hypothetical protein
MLPYNVLDKLNNRCLILTFEYQCIQYSIKKVLFISSYLGAFIWINTALETHHKYDVMKTSDED